MKTTTRLVCAMMAFALTACAAPPPQVVIHSTYNPDEIAYMKVPGNNTIKVNAFLLQGGGGNVTCAGREVDLFGISAYATERLLAICGSISNPRVASWGSSHLPQPDPRYIEDSIKKTCDSEGRAVFENIADGEYYITTAVWWESPTGYNASMEWNGGNIMRKVSVSDGETLEVIMSH